MSSIAIVAKRVVTMDPERNTSDSFLGAIEDAAVVVEGGLIAWIGSRASCPPADERIEANLVTPGLCDAHTHAAWSGSRHLEYTMKLAGRDYRDIAKAGGGIVSTHRAIAAISEEALTIELQARLRRMASLGVTTVEVKSGYGLEPEHELKQLRAIRSAASDPTLPRIVPTFLALHAMPPSASDRASYIAGQVVLIAEVASRGLAKYVDAYIDGNAFSVEEARPALTAANTAGLAIRLHIGQFAEIGGAALAAEFGAHSVDHMENVTEQSLALLRDAGTHVGLLPTASFVLNQTPPPIELFRAANLPLVVASDANPGTAPSESLPLALAFAARLYKLTAEEALRGATTNAARSLNLPNLGALITGTPADLVAWDLPHEYALLQPWGVKKTTQVFRDGQRLQ